MRSIAVIGSLNMDIVNRVEKAPLPGQTIKALETSYVPGGKGANQAVAAARAGARVEMFGAVGADTYGEILLENLRSSRVGTESVLLKQDVGTGLAFITVDELGENSIIISPGANGKVETQDVQVEERQLLEPDIIILQNEIPYSTVAYALEYFGAKGKYIIYNPAPAFAPPENAFSRVGLLILNETEAAVLSGAETGTIEEVHSAAKILVDKGCREVIVTLGAKGLFYLNREGTTVYLPAFKVAVTDTTAAGDTFVGAYATAMVEGKPVQEALRFASAASALTVTRKGAQTSIPERLEIDAFLSQRQFVDDL
ncbi:ribokinase [Desulfosporosinus acidiphilus SJ4]|uniref:Ribokinase n=1 Tax=Desulfosporosinus acidiphilus (strain DSM 22704 / JCM 16185 / SJ4) TaxID=646529 RepID=I4D7C1_DESAJ|nr:ribokinase [Desulfosporosinus acidiphilus]AFM41695.1 ribokinase [Desulfosporosinus acidiphilus SJ4]